MKGMVFFLYGLPTFLARAGPRNLGGRGGKDVVRAPSIGHRRQVWGFLFMSTGVDIPSVQAQLR